MQKVNQQNWYLIDLNGKVFGRACSDIARIILGKADLDFSYNKTATNHVVAINSDKIKFTGKKTEQKSYHSHTGYIGNLKTVSLKDMLHDDSDKLILKGVAGMLPKNKLQDINLSKLKVYKNSEHPHKNAKFQEIK